MSLFKIFLDFDKFKKRYGLRFDRIFKYVIRNDDVLRDLRYYLDYFSGVDSCFNIKGFFVFNKSINDYLNLFKIVCYVIVGKDYEFEDVVIWFIEFN